MKIPKIYTEAQKFLRKNLRFFRFENNLGKEVQTCGGQTTRGRFFLRRNGSFFYTSAKPKTSRWSTTKLGK